MTQTQTQQPTVDVVTLRKILQSQGSIDLGEGITIEKVEIPEEEDERNCPRGHISVIDAMSVAYQIIADNETNHGPKTYSYFMNPDEEKDIVPTQESVDKANELFDYYSKRFFEEKLKGTRITDWQDAVAKFVAVKERTLKTKNVRLLSTLPRFMECDLLKSKYSDISLSAPKDMQMYVDMTTKWDDEILITRLKFLEKYHNHNSNKNVMTYLFNSQANNIFEYSIPTRDGTKIELMDYLIKTQPEIHASVAAQSKPFFGNFNSMDIKFIKLYMKEQDL